MIQERLEQVIKNLQALEQSVDSRSVAKGILADIETLKDISQSLVSNPGYRLVRVDDENSFFLNNLQQQIDKANLNETHPDSLVVSRDVLSALSFNTFEQQIAKAHLTETQTDGLSCPASRDQEIKEITDSFKLVVKAVWLKDTTMQPDKNKTTSDRNVDVAQFVKDTLDVAKFENIPMKSLSKHDVEKVNRICTSFVYNAINAVAMSFTNYSKLAAYLHDFNGELADYTHVHYWVNIKSFKRQTFGSGVYAVVYFFSIIFIHFLTLKRSVLYAFYP